MTTMSVTVIGSVSRALISEMSSTPAPPRAAEPGASLLPPPADGFASLDTGDVGAALAKLVLENAYAQRKENRTARAAAEKAQEVAEQKQLAEMREAADDRLWSGIVSGGLTVASAMCTFASAGPSGQAALIGDGADHAQRSIRARATNAAMSWKAGSEALGGTAKILGSVIDNGATAHDREATRAEHDAAREKRNGDDAQSSADDAKRMIDRALDFYRDYLTAQADAQKAAIMRA
jgi:hypothetical protein